MNPGQELSLIDVTFHPNGTDQVAWFETDACHDYWVMWSYGVANTPQLYQFDSREAAEQTYSETVNWWLEYPEGQEAQHR